MALFFILFFSLSLSQSLFLFRVFENALYYVLALNAYAAVVFRRRKKNYGKRSRANSFFLCLFLLANGRATLGGVFLPFLGRRITCRVGRPPVVRLRRRRRRRSETSRARNAAHVIPVGTTRHARPPPCTRVLALAFSFFLFLPLFRGPAAVMHRKKHCRAATTHM